MLRWTTLLAAVAIALPGCDEASSDPQRKVEHADRESSEANNFCQRLSSTSRTADELMQAAFVLSKDGEQYGGAELIETLVKDGGYSFKGTETLHDACWAYAEAKGSAWGKSFHLQWRCPVKAYRDDPGHLGSATLEIVASEKCDFGVAVGAPAYQDLRINVMKL